MPRWLSTRAARALKKLPEMALKEENPLIYAKKHNKKCLRAKRRSITGGGHLRACGTFPDLPAHTLEFAKHTEKSSLRADVKGIHGATHFRACRCFSCMPSFPLECYENYAKLHPDRSSQAAIPLDYGVQRVSRVSNKTGG